MPLNEYIQQINRAQVDQQLQHGQCQQALQQLLKTDGLSIDLDWQRAEAGGPALILWRGQVAVGCVFTTTGDLKTLYSTVQPLLRILPNVLLTNFLEFRYGDTIARLGNWQSGHIEWERNTALVMSLLHGWATARMPTIRAADDLAQVVALFAAQLRDAIHSAITDAAPARDLLEHRNAWQMDSDQTFADQYAQMLVFSLIAARMRHSGAARAQVFTVRDAIWDQPSTNPFARDVFRELEKLDARVQWLLDMLVARLEHTDIATLRLELGRRSRQDNPLSRLHNRFYEHYGSPSAGVEAARALALYIVSSVHYLVQRRFKRALGLADGDVSILLPTLDDGTLLHFILQQTHMTLRQQQQLGAWDSFVADDLLPRLYAYAPSLAVHAWVHMRFSLHLQNTAYSFDSTQPLNVHLQPSDQPVEAPRLRTAFAPTPPPTLPIQVVIDVNENLSDFLKAHQAKVMPGGIATLLLPVDFLTDAGAASQRAALLHTFSDIYLLHVPMGVLALLTRRANWSGDMARRVSYAAVDAAQVEAWLGENSLTSTNWQELYPQTPDFTLMPPDNGGSYRVEYERGWRLNNLLPVSEPGMRVENGSFISGQTTQPVLVRPFDVRHFQHVPPVLKPMRRGDNLGLCMNNGCVLVTDQLIHADLLGEQTMLFPLYVYPETAMLVSKSPFAPGIGGRRPNLDSQFVLRLAERLGMTFIPDGHGDNRDNFGPEDIFYYMYAVFNSPTFAERYGRYFDGNLPRLPLPESDKLFRNLAHLGRDLARSHLLYRAGNWPLLTGFNGPGDSRIAPEHPRFIELAGEPGGRIHINREKYFNGVERAVWNMQVGGVYVLREWLSAREAHLLTWADVRYFQRIIVALTRAAETLSEIEEIFAD